MVDTHNARDRLPSPHEFESDAWEPGCLVLAGKLLGGNDKRYADAMQGPSVESMLLQLS
jgi:hypothetical protein